MSSYWRAAGLTYLAYANKCASHVRACLKEPAKSAAIAREEVHYKVSKWVDGNAEAPGMFCVQARLKALFSHSLTYSCDMLQ